MDITGRAEAYLIMMQTLNPLRSLTWRPISLINSVGRYRCLRQAESGHSRLKPAGLVAVLAWLGWSLVGAKPAGAATIGLHWNGTETVWWAIYPLGGKNRVAYSGIGAGQTQRKEVAPGTYEVHVEAPGFKRVRVATGTMYTPAVGQVAVQWNGIDSVWWTVYPTGGGDRICSRAVGSGQTAHADIAAGSYEVNVEAPGFPYWRVEVRDGLTTRVLPPVGRLTLRWSGTKRVWWSVYAAGGKDRISYRAVDPGQTSSRDIAPGSYDLQIDQPGYGRVAFIIQNGRMTVVPLQ